MSIWLPMTKDLPIVSVEKGRKVTVRADHSSLILEFDKKLPKGPLLLCAQSSPHFRYWYQEVEADGKSVTVSTDGLSQAWDSCGDDQWKLYLGNKTKNGIVLRPIRWDLQPEQSLEDRNFLDDRARCGTPLPFDHHGQPCCAMPFVKGKLPRLFLRLSRHDRFFLDHVSCRLTSFEVHGETVRFSVACPPGLDSIAGLSLLPEGADAPILFPAHPSDSSGTDRMFAGEFPLYTFNMLSAGVSELTCVLGETDGVLSHGSLRIGDHDFAASLQPRWEMTPLHTFGELGCYLSVSYNHKVRFHVSPDAPGAQHPGCASLTEYLASPLRHSQHVISAVSRAGSDWHWRLSFPGTDLSDADELMVCMERPPSSVRVHCLASAVPEGRGSLVTADLAPLIPTIENTLPTDWIVFLAIRRGERFWYLPILDPIHADYQYKVQNTTFGFAMSMDRSAIGTTPFAGQTVAAYVHWARKFDSHQMVLRLSDQCLRHSASFVCRAEWGKLRFGWLSLCIDCPKIDGKWTGMVLTHRYKLEDDRKDYFIPCSKLEDKGDYYAMTVSVNVHTLRFTPLQWDIRAVFEFEGVSFWIPVRAPKPITDPEELKKQEEALPLFGESSVLSPKFQLFLYRTTNSNRFALVCQERTPYSGFRFRMKEREAIKKYEEQKEELAQQKIILVYEKYCCMAQDNGFYFFKYCMDNDMEAKLGRKIYFVIDTKSKDYKTHLLPYQDHVIPFMSLQHMIYLLAAKLLVSSDSKSHAYAWRCKESIIQPLIAKQKRLVFLGHGVTAMKMVDVFSAASGTADLFVTTSERERDIVIDELGYKPQNVVITGLPRWDVMEDRSKGPRIRKLLLMPTWRNWLEEVSEKTFRKSDYFRSYMELLNSKELASYLERHSLRLDFYIHPKFREYLGSFSTHNKWIRLIPFGTEPLNELMMESSLLITDYSSVCWDMFYQGKPVLFYQFDVDKYNEAQGSYIDMETELCGDRAMTLPELFRLLEEYASRDFGLKPKYADLRRQTYQYIDRHNSLRVCDEIRKRNW